MHHPAARALALVPFDPHQATPEEWGRLHAYRRVRLAEDFPGDPLVPDADFEHALREPHPLHQMQRIMAARGDDYVGNLVLTWRRPGSPNHADHAPFVDAGGGVPLAHRRQGVGTALLGALHGFMAAHGQSVVSLKVQSAEGRAFMAARGAELRLRSVENRLPFHGLDWSALARWQAQATSPGDGLRWETHAGRVPMPRLAQLMEPLTTLINEQPLGSLEMPRIRYTLEGYDRWYADMDRRGGEHFMVLLCHGEALVAVCDASWDARFADRVYQQLTAVAQPWRGRGLAKGVKAAMLQLIHARHPGVRTMITTNAEANGPMLSINQRLGFAMHREEGTYQFTLDALAPWAQAGQ
ncbi:MAG: N-acetyltransferase [Ramlibacter sp.]